MRAFLLNCICRNKKWLKVGGCQPSDSETMLELSDDDPKGEMQSSIFNPLLN